MTPADVNTDKHKDSQSKDPVRYSLLSQVRDGGRGSGAGREGGGKRGSERENIRPGIRHSPTAEAIVADLCLCFTDADRRGPKAARQNTQDLAVPIRLDLALPEAIIKSENFERGMQVAWREQDHFRMFFANKRASSKRGVLTCLHALITLGCRVTGSQPGVSSRLSTVGHLRVTG